MPDFSGKLEKKLLILKSYNHSLSKLEQEVVNQVPMEIWMVLFINEILKRSTGTAMPSFSVKLEMEITDLKRYNNSPSKLEQELAK